MSDLLQTQAQETLLWIGTGGMAAGAVAILAVGRGLGRHAHHATASFFVCAIAASLYLLMAQGQGDVVISGSNVALTANSGSSGGELIYFARYIDWIVTTPLLLVGLLSVGLVALQEQGEAVRQRIGLVGGVIGADILMIVTGLFGALSVDSGHKYTWFVVSCLFFLGVLAVVWGPVRASAVAQGGDVAALYNRLLTILTGLWLIYPVLWILGTEGTGTISLDTEVGVFTVIDLLAKVGFGLVLVTGIKKLSARAPRPTQQAPEAA